MSSRVRERLRGEICRGATYSSVCGPDAPAGCACGGIEEALAPAAPPAGGLIVSEPPAAEGTTSTPSTHPGPAVLAGMSSASRLAATGLSSRHLGWILLADNSASRLWGERERETRCLGGLGGGFGGFGGFGTSGVSGNMLSSLMDIEKGSGVAGIGIVSAPGTDG